MFHPLLKQLVRTQTRQALEDQGYGLLKAIRLSKAVSDSTIEAAVSSSPPEVEAQLTKVTAIGDGSILKFFTDFLNSDLGKMLIALIIKLITGV